MFLQEHIQRCSVHRQLRAHRRTTDTVCSKHALMLFIMNEAMIFISILFLTHSTD